MPRYRLYPTPALEAVLREHCAHARYVWNLAVEQHSHWNPRRLEDKATGRVERINPRYTSQICSGCRHRDPESRESQSRFRCRACGLTVNADVNAARNIAAGHAVTARGGDGITRPVNREPHLLASLTGRE
jgi:hypothetical protein